MLTKGKMINALKKTGIRDAEKQGVGLVDLSHLKFAQICNMYGKLYKGENND